MIVDTLATSLLMTVCSKFLLQKRATHGRLADVECSIASASAEFGDERTKRRRCRPGSLVTDRHPGRLGRCHGHTGL